MIVLYIALALIVVLLVILLVRAINFKPLPSSAKTTETLKVDGDELAKRFSQLIQCKTVTFKNPSEVDAPEHEKFIELIQKLYPNVFKKCEFKRVNKYGLVLKFKGKSDKNPSCIMSHYDVVPVTPANWSVDPFSGLIKDGCVWGRGTLDNKATLFCSMEAMEATLKEDPNFMPEDDIYYTFGGDEEENGQCQQAIVKEFEEAKVYFKLVLDEGGAIVSNIFPGVKEETAVIGLAEKGITDIELMVESRGGHASTPTKDDPVNVLMRALLNIEKNPMPCVISSPIAGMLDTLGRYSSFGLKIVFANMWLFSGLVKKIFANGKETRAMLTTTFAYTTLSGANAHNIIPNNAKCNLNIRISNNTTVDEVVAHLKKVINDERVIITPGISSNPSPIAKIDDFGYMTVKSTMNEVYPEVVVSPYIMLAASDSRYYRNVSANTLKFAPLRMTTKQRGSIHGDNEFIEIKALENGTQFYYNLLKKL